MKSLVSLRYQWSRAGILSVASDSFGGMGCGAVVDREAITAAFDALDAAVDGVAALDFDALCAREWLVLL
ncbi:hypothetical protein, partial [Mycobacterium haemophilum]|uniref:hypothetical protein n=1 Tax=Mycobacterium haemophilum TaxID=29311 RepID=UPI003B00804C